MSSLRKTSEIEGAGFPQLVQQFSLFRPATPAQK
jgi:hypothetical protein